MPDAGTVVDYNRFLYARANPLKLSDPSGHVAICFQGGPNTSNKEKSASFRQMCNDVLSAGGYDKEKHGDILYFRYNNKGAKQSAMNAVLGRDPSEPAIVIGYSWGGAAALEMASTLAEYQQSMAEQPLVNEEMIKLANLDLLLTIEPEPDGRMNTPSSVGKNVHLAVNIAAANGWPEFVGPFGGTDHFGNVQNGMNEVTGSLNVDIEEVNGVRMNHHTIIDLNAGDPKKGVSINPRTREWGGASVTVALWGY